MPRKPEKFQEIRDKSRSQILNTALGLFAKKGYHGTSINDIAMAAGISKGLAYNYFDSKQKLAEEVINLLFVKMADVFKVLAGLSDPQEKINQFITLIIDEAIGNEEFWRLYFSLVLQPELTPLAEALSSDVFLESINFLETNLSEIGIQNAAMEAKLLAGIMDGVLFHKMFLKEKYPLEEVKKYLLQKYSREKLGA
ncbi:MAG: TetR/AcrR family transcriptional regulator [bacterium]